MTLPILLIFYVSKWKIIRNIEKSEYDVTVTSSLGVASQNWVWGFFVRRWSLCVNFMTLALLVPEIQRGGPRSSPPVKDWPKKPSLDRVKIRINWGWPSQVKESEWDSDEKSSLVSRKLTDRNGRPRSAFGPDFWLMNNYSSSPNEL